MLNFDLKMKDEDEDEDEGLRWNYKSDSKKCALFFIFDVIYSTSEAILINLVSLKRYYRALYFHTDFYSDFFKKTWRKMKMKISNFLLNSPIILILMSLKSQIFADLKNI